MILLAAYLGLRSHTFLASFPHDEGLFLYGGQAWANGELPYRDFWDHKPAGTFFFHSIPLRLFPFSIPAVKIHECFWLALSAFFFFSLCRQKFSRTASIGSLLFYLFYTSSPHTIRTGGLTEESALFFILFSYWLILRKKGNFLTNAFCAGLCVGAAIQFRQTFVFESLLLLGASFHAIQTQGQKWTQTWKPLLLIALGLVIPEFLVSLYFLIHGVWFDYIEASYLYNLFYVGPARASKPPWDILAIQWNFVLSSGPYLLAPFLAIATAFWTPKTIRWIFVPLLLTFLGDAFSISLSGEYYEHYYVQAASSLNLLLALFLEGIVRGMSDAWIDPSRRLRNYGLSAYSFVLLAFVGFTVYAGVTHYVSYYRDVLTERNESESPYTFQREAAAAAQSLTDPNDRILLIGRDPNSIYILSQRYAGSRYYHYSPLWKEKLVGALTQRQQEVFWGDLNERRPVLILLDRRANQRFAVENGFAHKTDEYLQKNYTPLENLVERSPEDRWFWYGPNLTFLIRNEKIQEVKQRYAARGV